MELTEQQKVAYNRFIKARNSVALGQYRHHNKKSWRPTSEVACTVDVEGMNHPLFEMNDDWTDYVSAFEAWLAIEPQWRKDERMSMIRGDYGGSDNWQEKKPKVREIE